MNVKNLILTGLVALVAGLLLVLMRASLADGRVVVAAGILFAVAGVLDLALIVRPSEKRKNAGAVGTVLGWIAAAAAIIFGLAMIIFKSTFAGLVGFILGVLLVFLACFQFYLILFGSRPSRLPGWLYIVPTSLVACAVYIFTSDYVPGRVTEIVIAGAGFMAFGAAAIAEYFILKSRRHVAPEATGDVAK